MMSPERMDQIRKEIAEGEPKPGNEVPLSITLKELTDLMDEVIRLRRIVAEGTL